MKLTGSITTGNGYTDEHNNQSAGPLTGEVLSERKGGDDQEEDKVAHKERKDVDYKEEGKECKEGEQVQKGGKESRRYRWKIGGKERRRFRKEQRREERKSGGRKRKEASTVCKEGRKLYMCSINTQTSVNHHTNKKEMTSSSPPVRQHCDEDDWLSHEVGHR